MRKPDEIALYAALRLEARARAVGNITTPRPVMFEDPAPASSALVFSTPLGAGWALPGIARALGIPEKRAWALLKKWSDRGWWNYGVSLRGGWFEPGAPESLSP